MTHKVTYARLHQAPHIPQVGNMDAVFPSPSKVYDSLDMNVTDLGLYISFRFKEVKHTMLIPLANVIVMSIDPKEHKSSSKP